MDAIKITKVIDYTGGYYILFGNGKSCYEVWCWSVQEASSALGMLSPWLPGTYIVQSSPKVQDGVSFFFKMESAWPVPFLLQSNSLNSQSTDNLNKASTSLKIMENAMTTHSSTLAWKTPWTEEPGRLQSVGSQRVRHNWEFTFTFTIHI